MRVLLYQFQEVVAVIYNMHTHSNLSHDAKDSPDMMCEAAIAAKLRGIAFTEHCDSAFFPKEKLIADARKNFKVQCEMAEKYGDRLLVMKGVEVGDAHLCFDEAESVATALPYDAVLGSVHVMLDTDGRYITHTKAPFGEYSAERLDAYLKDYFDGLLFTAKNLHFDILTHLDLPIRYIARTPARVDMTKYTPIITEILKTIIKRGIALEINTSDVTAALGDTLPSQDIIKLYKSLGGTMITLGSDAHMANTIVNGLVLARDMLLSLGFTEACYYKERKPQFYSLEEI